MIKSVLDMNVENKRVLVRVDFNVPMQEGVITSTIRIDEAMQTINYLLERNAKVILCSHMGRPDGKKVKKYSLKPVYEYLKTLLPNTNVIFANDCIGEKTKQKALALKTGEVLLLENLRYYNEEEANDKAFAKNLASLAQIYVNDAFGTAHRKHASTYGVAEFLPSCCGFLIKRELDAFQKIDNPERPFVAILGGAKIKDKLAVTQNLLNKVDTLLIGGGMAYTFLKAQGKNIGTSILSEENLDFCKDVLNKAKEKGINVVLPIDVVCAEDMKATNTIKTFKANKIPANMGGFDIGKKTAKLFAKYIKSAKTVVWNGPLGVYEMEEFAVGTKKVVLALAKNQNCYSIIGGGDVVSAVEKYNLSSKISHVSTGGGASLKLIEGSILAGVEALNKKEEKSSKKPVAKKKAAKKATAKVVKQKEEKLAKPETKKAETKKVVVTKAEKVEPKKEAVKAVPAKITKTASNVDSTKPMAKKVQAPKASTKKVEEKKLPTTKAVAPKTAKAVSKPVAKPAVKKVTTKITKKVSTKKSTPKAVVKPAAKKVESKKSSPKSEAAKKTTTKTTTKKAQKNKYKG